MDICRQCQLLCEGQPDLLDPLTRLLQNDHIGQGFLVIIVVADDQLNCDLHGNTPPAGRWARDGPMVAGGLWCPQICMLSSVYLGEFWGFARLRPSMMRNPRFSMALSRHNGGRAALVQITHPLGSRGP